MSVFIQFKKVVLHSVICVLLLTGCEKYALDRQMDELCRKDGHLTVYERVELPPIYFDQNNNVHQITSKTETGFETRIGGDYLERFRLTIIKGGDPLKGEGLLERRLDQMIRISDGKLLAESVQYVRAGGDGLHLGHHTTKLCPPIEGGLASKVFFKQSPTPVK